MRIRLAVAVPVLIVALALPPLSADVWAYAAYGALLGRGVDPWAHAFGPAAIAGFRDPVLDAALGAWNGSLPRDVYGPLFTLPAAALVATLRPWGPAAVVLAFRIVAAAGLIGCIALAAPRRPALSAALSLHPVVLWSAAEGHNDPFWLALVLAADCARTRRGALAALIAGTAVKAVAAIPLVLRIARDRDRRATWTALALAAVAYAPLGWSVIAHGLDRSIGAPRLSLVHGPALAAWSGSPIPFITAAAMAALGGVGVVRAWRSGDRLAGLALAGWIALPSPEPWYAIWLLPVVTAVRRSPAALGLAVATVTGLAGYAQDAVVGTALRDPTFLGGTMLAHYALPLLLAAISPAPSPQPLPAQPAPPTPPPLASPAPQPLPVATTTPTPAPAASLSPAPSATPVPTAAPTPPLFGYVVTPPPAAGTPRITEVALNDRTLHRGGMLLVRIVTSLDVTSLSARTMGREIGIPLQAPGVFAGQQQLPDAIPSFLLGRTYQIEFIANTADGHSTSFSLPLRLER
ncbi:hypothetical protein [Vulcanimicrobium alpinum]|uniref:hypothetical protein n=1 Tax=Vulcanimicrobium alpinum TaxID=3016050 RepID=UPI00295F2741|nr:hypothetical protein [Vulcanimicrobium alpinum]